MNAALIDAGYFARRVAPRPDWLQAPDVREICSVSECISGGHPDWIQTWRHNGLGWFNRAQDATGVVPADELQAYRLFAYRILPDTFGSAGRAPMDLPADLCPDPIPATFRSRGFDSVSRSGPTVLGFECSPLSCNGMASELPVNEFCLFPTLEAAMAGATRFAREQPEPGDYYVVEVLEAPDA